MIFGFPGACSHENGTLVFATMLPGELEEHDASATPEKPKRFVDKRDALKFNFLGRLESIWLPDLFFLRPL